MVKPQSNQGNQPFLKKILFDILFVLFAPQQMLVTVPSASRCQNMSLVSMINHETRSHTMNKTFESASKCTIKFKLTMVWYINHLKKAGTLDQCFLAFLRHIFYIKKKNRRPTAKDFTK